MVFKRYRHQRNKTDQLLLHQSEAPKTDGLFLTHEKTQTEEKPNTCSYLVPNFAQLSEFKYMCLVPVCFLKLDKKRIRWRFSRCDSYPMQWLKNIMFFQLLRMLSLNLKLCGQKCSLLLLPWQENKAALQHYEAFWEWRGRAKSEVHANNTCSVFLFTQSCSSCKRAISRPRMAMHSSLLLLYWQTYVCSPIEP